MKRVYVDNAAAGLPSSRQMEEWAKYLCESTLSNPHSRHLSAQLTANIISNARQRVLKFLNASEEKYEVVFTQNATHSLSIIAERFDFGKQSESTKICPLGKMQKGNSSLIMFEDSHNSVVGMRECRRFDELVITSFGEVSDYLSVSTEFSERKLFVMTAMSNFCGRKYDLSIIPKIQQKLGWKVCLDAAAWVSVSALDLDSVGADFVVLSFYKIFGYPTGIGALVVRKESSHFLKSEGHCFGGGTVEYVSPFDFDVHFRSETSERLEMGTGNFHSVAALRFGFEDICRFGGMSAVERHCMELSVRLFKFLLLLRHSNGSAVIRLYGEGWKWADGDDLYRNQGEILNFNILRDDGSVVGFVEVENMCDLFGIELRTGAMCNMGSSAKYLGLSQKSLQSFRKLGKGCGDTIDLIEGNPTGSIRISFGRLNTFEDVEVIQKMINCCFVSASVGYSLRMNDLPVDTDRVGRLERICLYPIKSAASLSPKRWFLSSGGLCFDRQWMVVNADGVPLTQKRFPILCSISSFIDGDQIVLSDRYGIMAPLRIENLDKTKNEIPSKLCSQFVRFDDCGEKAAKWLSDFGLPSQSRLVRIQENGRNFSNRADYLLITMSSIRFIAELSSLDEETVAERFRANFIVETGCNVPFEEDDFESVRIGSSTFKVVAPCKRCEMIAIDQRTGDKDPNILLRLRDIRADKQFSFGVYLARMNDDNVEKEIVTGTFINIERRGKTFGGQQTAHRHLSPNQALSRPTTKQPNKNATAPHSK